MKRSSLFALAAFAALSLPALANAAPDWRTWNEGLKLAASSGKPVIVDIYTDWCGWCKRMDRDVYAKPAVSEYLRSRYVTVRLNAEAADEANYEGHRYSSEELAQRFRVSGYPTTIFLRANGEHLVNVPGYLDSERFLLLLRYVAEGHADRNEPFDEFVKQQSTAARGGR